jgi:hypothetical protein
MMLGHRPVIRVDRYDGEDLVEECALSCLRSSVLIEVHPRKIFGDDNCRDDDVRLRPNRPGPSRTEGRLEKTTYERIISRSQKNRRSGGSVIRQVLAPAHTVEVLVVATVASTLGALANHALEHGGRRAPTVLALSRALRSAQAAPRCVMASRDCRRSEQITEAEYFEFVQNAWIMH